MTLRKPASDEYYRQVWAAEIELGIAKGKLSEHCGGKADLKTVALSPGDHEELTRKYGK